MITSHSACINSTRMGNDAFPQQVFTTRKNQIKDLFFIVSEKEEVKAMISEKNEKNERIGVCSALRNDVVSDHKVL